MRVEVSDLRFWRQRKPKALNLSFLPLRGNNSFQSKEKTLRKTWPTWNDRKTIKLPEGSSLKWSFLCSSHRSFLNSLSLQNCEANCIKHCNPIAQCNNVSHHAQVVEESPPASPSSSEEGEGISSKGKKTLKRNKSVYKISISPNKSYQAKSREGKLRIKMVKVTKNDQGRLTVTEHREGSPSLGENNLSYERLGNGDHMTSQPGVSALSRDNRVFVNGGQSLPQVQAPGHVSILSVVPMVTNSSAASTLSYPVQNSMSSVGNLTSTSNSQFLPQNPMSNAIPINQISGESCHTCLLYTSPSPRDA